MSNNPCGTFVVDDLEVVYEQHIAPQSELANREARPVERPLVYMARSPLAAEIVARLLNDVLTNARKHIGPN